MKTEQSIAVMKALADPSRLAIVNSLLERSQYAEEIAKRHALAPSTVSFHLRKLELAGLVTSRKEQYYTVVEANQEIFATTLREIVSAPAPGRELQEERMDEYRHKVLESFYRNGRVDRLPAQHKKRLIVLDLFALRFEPGRRYGEQEVTGLIVPLFDDYCTIRRLLIEEGLVKRDGGAYWREAGVSPAALQPQVKRSESAKEKRVTKDDERANLKRVYKQHAPEMGVYQIRNTKNGRIYLKSTPNLDGTRNSRLFQLRMGKVVFSRELQKDLDEYGAESFEFSVLAVLERPEPGDDVERSLAALELHWLEKLRPFGERGYNSAKACQREMTRLRRQGGEAKP